LRAGKMKPFGIDDALHGMMSCCLSLWCALVREVEVEGGTALRESLSGDQFSLATGHVSLPPDADVGWIIIVVHLSTTHSLS
jgi:hypothetical protein